MERKWLIVALGNLLIATCIGLLLRFAFVEEVSWLHFKPFLHAHSHVAMLGWIYMALAVMLIPVFTQRSAVQEERYDILFWITQLAVIGMLVSFPLQGYGPISIGFSVLHILCSYVFVLWLWRSMSNTGALSEVLLRLALGFMVLSTVAIWMMGPIMATSLRGSTFYYMAVQFYLHFQFNGWFLFGVLALFFRYLESQGMDLASFPRKLFLWFLVSSCFLTYALAIAWANPMLPVFLANSLGVMLQLAALFVFVRWFWPQRQLLLSKLSVVARYLLVLGLVSMAGKIIVQAAVVLPFVAKAAYTIRNYVIGFIHLILLGAITAALLAYALHWGWLRMQTRLSKAGLIVLFSGFLLSEFVLFLQGTLFWGAMGFLPYYYELLFAVSGLIPLGVLILIIGQIRERRLLHK